VLFHYWGMWQRQPSPDRAASGVPQAADLGSQLEDLIVHVFRCEKWARLDDRIDLALNVDRLRPLPRRHPG
jgi:hypothetical protein